MNKLTLVVLCGLVCGCEVDRTAYGAGPRGVTGESGEDGEQGPPGAPAVIPAPEEQVVYCKPVFKDGVTISQFAIASFPGRTAEELTFATVTVKYTTGYLALYLQLYPEGFEMTAWQGGLVKDGAIATWCPMLSDGTAGFESVHVSVP